MALVNRDSGFWNRDFIVALVGYFFLFMSITLFYVFPLFLRQFSPSRSQVGLIMGAYSVMGILIRPFFGRLLDVRGRKKISLAGLIILLATVPWFHLVKDAEVLPVVLRALMGLGAGISMTAVMTICSDLAPAEKLAQSMGIVGVAGLVSVALGPMLGEEIIRRFGFSGLFNASLVCLLAALICVVLTREPFCSNQVKPLERPHILRSASFWTILVICSMPVIHGAVRSTMDYFIVLFSKSISIPRIGPFFLAFASASILTRLGVGDLSDRHGRKKVIFPSVLIIGFNLFLISRVSSLWMLILAGFIGGLGQGFIFPALSAYVIEILGTGNKGLALSLYLSLFDMGMGIGSPFFGRISDLYGFRTMYVVAGIFILFLGTLFSLKAPSPGKS
jgi:MFS family permease